MAKLKLNVIGANQTLVHLPLGSVLFSYETPVAAYVSGRGYVKTSRKFSNTTTKHVNSWLGGAKAEEVSQEEIEALIEVKL